MCQIPKRRGSSFGLDTKNNIALPLDLACPESLGVWSSYNPSERERELLTPTLS
jgi:hypothetical protein